jgi:hypothetical protein
MTRNGSAISAEYTPSAIQAIFCRRHHQPSPNNREQRVMVPKLTDEAAGVADLRLELAPVEEVADSTHSSGQRRAPSSTTESRSDTPRTTFQDPQVLRDSRGHHIRSPHLHNRIRPLLRHSRRWLRNQRVYKPAG